MKKIKDDELREYQSEIGQKEYKKFQMNYCNKSARIRNYNLRASRQHYENTEYPIHEMTKFILCSDCQKKIKQDITDDLLEYERQKVIEWVRKKKD